MPRGQWSEEKLKLAVRSVLMDGLPKKAASRRYGIPRPTLQRHVQSAQNGLGIEKRFGRHCVLTPEQEEDLVSRLLDMEARFYGLRPMDVRTIQAPTSTGVNQSIADSHQIISMVDVVEPSTAAGQQTISGMDAIQAPTSSGVNQSIADSRQIISMVDVVEPIPIPKNDRISKNGRMRRAVAHASVVTNSPYKLSLELAKGEKIKELSAQSKKKQEKVTKRLSEVKRKATNEKEKRVRKSNKQVTDDDDYTKCGHCGAQYNDVSAAEYTDNWIQCGGCKA